MDFTKVVSISGYAGLYKAVSETKFGLVVESLEDGKRFPAYSYYKISKLSDISIYTDKGDSVPLKDVLMKIYSEENGNKCISHSAAEKEVTAYFEKILPEYDKDRVYLSDIRKVLKWYNVLQSLNLLKPEEKKEEKMQEKEAEKNETGDSGSPLAGGSRVPGEAKEEESDHIG